MRKFIQPKNSKKIIMSNLHPTTTGKQQTDLNSLKFTPLYKALYLSVPSSVLMFSHNEHLQQI